MLVHKGKVQDRVRCQCNGTGQLLSKVTCPWKQQDFPSSTFAKVVLKPAQETTVPFVSNCRLQLGELVGEDLVTEPVHKGKGLDRVLITVWALA